MILEKEAKSGDTVTRVCDDCGKIDTLIKGNFETNTGIIFDGRSIAKFLIRRPGF